MGAAILPGDPWGSDLITAAAPSSDLVLPQQPHLLVTAGSSVAEASGNWDGSTGLSQNHAKLSQSRVDAGRRQGRRAGVKRN